jgi:hypothetical protein
MSIHVKRTGSTRSWVGVAAMIVLSVVVLATGYFGLR